MRGRWSRLWVRADEVPIYSQTTLTLVDLNGESLSKRLATILRPQFAHKKREWQDEKDARYALRASGYHLEMLAASYARHAERGKTDAQKRRDRGAPGFIWSATDDARVFYEVDAFFGTARRFYEQLRKVLWKRFGPDGWESLPRPRSFEKAMNAVDLEPHVETSLLDSWTSTGRS